MTTPVVLFVCSRNGGKSQLAAALMRHEAGERAEVHSAGTSPGDFLNPEVVAALDEIGLSTEGEHPKAVDPEMLRRADRLVVLGNEAHVDLVDGMHATLERWVTDEPSERGVKGMERMRLVRDDIHVRVQRLTKDLHIR